MYKHRHISDIFQLQHALALNIESSTYTRAQRHNTHIQTKEDT